MSQKHNSIRNCTVHAAISGVRQHSAAPLDAMADHERLTGPWEP